MDYFSILSLDREPFSNSPDPTYFYHSRQHVDCLQKLEIALRLRRGLNVVVGEVGTGKTTLCRHLIRQFADDGETESHLILDPGFVDNREFLFHLVELFSGQPPEADIDEWRLKEAVKQHIYRRGVDEGCNIVLIIDEGQKLSAGCLELLREFLNYETNEYKLLQIAIFAQKEFDDILRAQANFADRVNLYHLLEPLDFRDTRLMIHFRIRQASKAAGVPKLFTGPALWTIYRATEGYPRRIVTLCHRCVLAMIIQNRTRAGRRLVRSCVLRGQVPARVRRRWVPAAVLMLVLAAGLAGLTTGRFRLPLEEGRIAALLSGVAAGTPSSGPAFQAPPAPAPAAAPDPPLASQASKTRTPPELQSPPKAASFDAGGQPAADTPAEDKMPVTAAPPEPQGVDIRSEAEAGQPAPVLAVSLPEHGQSLPPVVESDAGPDPEALPAAPPDLLGSVRLEPDEVLSWLIVKIYGEYTPRRLRALKKSNPGMRPTKQMRAGDRIRFPASPVAVNPPGSEVWWVRLSETGSLEAALHRVRAVRSEDASVYIVPSWRPEGGLRFSVLLRGFFPRRQEAEDQRSDLESRTGIVAEVVAGWPPDTVFFSDPYQGTFEPAERRMEG